jgi:hypothetical protein
MIPFWNKREIGVYYSLQAFNEDRFRLEAAGIAYSYRTESLNPNRGHYGSAGINFDAAVMYNLYVHKRDFEATQAIIQTHPY